jgi:two-component system response regulator GlrR
MDAAGKGTLVLNEVTAMPGPSQASLVEALKGARFAPVGSAATRQLGARVVATTSRNLEAELSAGRLSRDLYALLILNSLYVAPLRARPEDIVSISRHYLQLVAKREGECVPRLTDAALDRLLSYSWPGNVRELIDCLERAALLAPGGPIRGEHICLPAKQGDLIVPYREAKAQFEQRYYSTLMRATAGNVSMAAKLAQKTRKEIYDVLRRQGLEATAYRRGQDGSGEHESLELRISRQKSAG